MTSIGILCATPEEFAALHSRLKLDSRPKTIAGFQFWFGELPYRPRKIVLAQSGIGKVNAATLATLMLTTLECEDLIFSGVAGALADLDVGSVILANKGATHDYGLMRHGEFTPVPVGELPTTAKQLSVLPGVPDYVEMTLELLRDRLTEKVRHSIQLGSVLSGDIFVNCVETRDRLRKLGGDAVDMESAAVLEVARRFNRAAYIIRTISDGAGDDSHLSYAEMAALAAENSALCVQDLLFIMP